MQIRLMRPDERGAVEHIYSTVHPKPESRRSWDGLTVLVASREGVVVGYASARWLGDQVWQLVEILVRPEFQGQGVGGDLMEARLALGRIQGAKVAVGGCDDDHEQMRYMFDRWGFVPMPGGAELLGRPNAHLYVKDLTNA